MRLFGVSVEDGRVLLQLAGEVDDSNEASALFRQSIRSSRKLDEPESIDESELAGELTRLECEAHRPRSRLFLDAQSRLSEEGFKAICSATRACISTPTDFAAQLRQNKQVWIETIRSTKSAKSD